jgi:primosomal protein N'
MEAMGWASPRGRGIVLASRTNDPLVQAVVRGNPHRFHADEARRRLEAGFPVGAAVFRVAGTSELEDRLAALSPITLIASSLADTSVCVIALERDQVVAFGSSVRALAAAGVVTRVEAEPHL